MGCIWRTSFFRIRLDIYEHKVWISCELICKFTELHSYCYDDKLLILALVVVVTCCCDSEVQPQFSEVVWSRVWLSCVTVGSPGKTLCNQTNHQRTLVWHAGVYGLLQNLLLLTCYTWHRILSKLAWIAIQMYPQHPYQDSVVKPIPILIWSLSRSALALHTETVESCHHAYLSSSLHSSKAFFSSGKTNTLSFSQLGKEGLKMHCHNIF